MHVENNAARNPAACAATHGSGARHWGSCCLGCGSIRTHTSAHSQSHCYPAAGGSAAATGAAAAAQPAVPSGSAAAAASSHPQLPLRLAAPGSAVAGAVKELKSLYKVRHEGVLGFGEGGAVGTV